MMKKRPGWKTTRNIYTDITRQLKAAAVTLPPTEADEDHCWDCVDYPTGGRSRGECLLRGSMVLGRTAGRPCFQERRKQP